MPGNTSSVPVLMSKLVARPGPRAIKILCYTMALCSIVLFDPAEAHDWYSGIRNPTTGVGCCGGNDCFIVRLEWLSEDAENFIVTFPSGVEAPIGTYLRGGQLQFKFPKSEAMPTRHIDTENPDDTGYSACIWGGKPRCFFYPMNV
jgi:hypothetical protein